MSFVGVISENDDFEFIEVELLENASVSNLRLINITDRNIDNMKNIKFETIVINYDICSAKIPKDVLDSILANTKYVLINSDIAINLTISKENKNEIITYGMNQKATVTTSSIKEDEILVCIQRNIKNVKSNIIEVQEIKKDAKKIDNKKTYNLLVCTILEEIYR